MPEPDSTQCSQYRLNSVQLRWAYLLSSSDIVAQRKQKKQNEIKCGIIAPLPQRQQKPSLFFWGNVSLSKMSRVIENPLETLWRVSHLAAATCKHCKKESQHVLLEWDDCITDHNRAAVTAKQNRQNMQPFYECRDIYTT